MRLATVAAAIAFAAAPAFPIGFDDLDKMSGKTIVYAGEFEPLDCPLGGKYDCRTWPRTLLRMSGVSDRCFGSDTLACGLGGCKGWVVVDRLGSREAFIIGGIGSRIERATYEPYRCPDPF